MRTLVPADVPFAPRRVPFFYGWVVVAAATSGVLFSIPGQTMGVSVFTDSLLEATGLGRLAFSNAYLLGTLGAAALLPRAGGWIDRLGVRAAALCAALALGAVVAVLSQADRVARAAAAVTALDPGAAGFAVLTLLFVGLRFLGQGVLTLVSNTMLARWFDRRRGLATAISGLFVAFGFGYAPRLLDAWIERAGWRGAWLEIAVLEVVGMGLLAWLFYREDPASCGLTLDGAAASPEQGDPRPAPPASTRAEALRTRAFWVLTASLALQGTVLTGITLHIVDIGAEAGLGRTAAVSLFLPMAVVSTAAGALVGWLADRVPIRTLVLSLLGWEALGFAASAHLGDPAGFWLAAFGLGVAGGHFSVLSAVGHPRFFGLRHLGAIAAASMSTVVVGSALGPSALALSRAALGSYQPAFYTAALLPLLVGLFALAPLHPRDVRADDP
ncbi:MAG: MFS transporter [Myxococcota bacterium]|nr:MFS transporter [Myxococcota bacterium]